MLGVVKNPFFALIDDIASVLDDVAVLSKVAARKTAGVLGDDLALNAQQVTGVRANRIGATGATSGMTPAPASNRWSG